MGDDNRNAADLAEAMNEALCALALGHPQVRVALAVTWVCGAMVRTCSRPGQEANALREAAAHLLRMAKKAEAEGAVALQ